MSTALLKEQPRLKNNSIIEFTINNKAVEESLAEDKVNLLGYLKKELNNYSITLQFVMSEAKDEKNLYTSKDRYKYLSEKNPDIDKLRRAFDLDLEF